MDNNSFHCELGYDYKIPVEFHKQSFEINESIEKGIHEYGNSKDQQARSKLETENRSYHLSSMVDFLKSLQTDPALGLTSEVVAHRLQRDGENVLKVKKKNPFVAYIMHFFSGFSLIMWIGAAMCFLSYKPLGDPPDPMTLGLGIVLLICILVMAIFSIVQEQKSSKVMKSILLMLPAQTTVTRNGAPQQIAASQLVEGDVVELSVGKVPADIRIIRATQLRVDNSVLTGESELITCTNVPTNENYMETKNVVFLGATIVEGTGQGVVVSTGERSVMGFITKSTSNESSTSYMQKEINRFMIFICIVAGSIGASLLFLWAVWLRTSYPTFLNISQMVTTCVGVIVGFLPDGLPVCITLTLTIIARRMFKNNILVKHLPTVENLGCVDVIASDKTGTLTQNKMSVARVCFGDQTYSIKSTSNEDQAVLMDNVSFTELLRVATLCNQAHFDATTDMEEKILLGTIYGNASDSALLSFSQGFWRTDTIRAQYQTIAEIPFNSRNKWAMSLHKAPNEDKILLLMKGATELMVKRSSTIFMGNQEVPLSDEMIEHLIKQQEQYGNQGERVLGFCRLWIDPKQFGVLDPDFNIDVVKDDLPMNNLCFVGMVCLIDPPREEVPQVITACKVAGIRVMMVTGDHAATAITIARWVNIITNDEIVHLTAENAERLLEEDTLIPKETLVSLDMLDENSEDEKLKKKSCATARSKKKKSKYHIITDADLINDAAIVIKGEDISSLKPRTWDWVLRHREIVFARTTPEHKLRIVKECQKRGGTVAVTGDGVNDAPALKRANCGIAMGSGSDIAREAADVILIDNNFASILTGIELGRTVFANLRKVVLYLLPAGSWSELLPILANVLLGVPLPLSAFLMIYICAITDLVPSISLIFETPESNVLRLPPRNPQKDHLVTWQLLLRAYGFMGMLESFFAFFIYFWYMASYGGMYPGDLFLLYDGDGFKGKTQKELDDLLYTAQTAFFITLVIVQFGNLLGIRTEYLSFIQHNPVTRQKTRNLYLFGGIVASMGLALLLVFIPQFYDIFHVLAPPYQFWLAPIGFSVFVFLCEEGRKLIVRRCRSSHPPKKGGDKDVTLERNTFNPITVQ